MFWLAGMCVTNLQQHNYKINFEELITCYITCNEIENLLKINSNSKPFQTFLVYLFAATCCLIIFYCFKHILLFLYTLKCLNNKIHVKFM